MSGFFYAQLDYIIFLNGTLCVFLAVVCFSMRDREKFLLHWSPFVCFALFWGLNQFLKAAMFSLGDLYALKMLRTASFAFSYIALLEFVRINLNPFIRHKLSRWLLLPYLLILPACLISGLGPEEINIIYTVVAGTPAGLCAGFLFFKLQDGRGKRIPSLHAAGLALMLLILSRICAVFCVRTGTYPFIDTFIIRQHAGLPFDTITGVFLFTLFICMIRFYRVRDPFLKNKTGSTFGTLKVLVLSAILTALFGGWLLTDIIGRFRTRELEKELLREAGLSVLAYPASELSVLEGSARDRQNPAYQRIRAQLFRMQSVNPRIRFFYLMGMKNGRIIFLADSVSEKDPGHSEPGVLYYKPPPVLHDVFKTGRSAIVGPYRDEYGSYKSAFATCRDPATGRIMAVLGLDIEAGNWLRDIFSIRVYSILIILLLVILLFSFYIYLKINYAFTMRLRESEEHYRDLFEQVTDIVFTSDHNLNFTNINSAVTKKLGYEKSEVVGRNVKEFTLPGYQEKLNDVLNRKIEASEIISTYDIEIRGKDGRMYILEVNSKGRYRDGKLYEILGVARDITDRKKAEEELIKARKNLQDIIEFLPDATFVISGEGKVIAWNQAMEKMTGIKKADMLGRGNYEYALPFYGIRRPILIDIARENITDHPYSYKVLSLKPGSIFAETFTPQLYQGKGAYVWGTASVLYDEEGRCTGAIETIRDVTDRKKLEMQLVQAEKMSAIGQMAAGIAHEFNNILTIISGTIQLLKMDDHLQKNREWADNFSTMEEATKRGASIVTKILALSRPGQPVQEICSITDILENILQLQKKQLELENISVKRDYAPVSMVNVDANQIEQVFLNLIINARDAIRPRGSGMITVAVRQAENEVEVEIRDTGTGMDQDAQKMLFTPFYTTKGAKARDRLGIPGTGLGLAISYSIITSHKGIITASSKVNEGTVFSIRLPAAEGIGGLPGAPAEEMNREKLMEKIADLAILIIDDDAGIHILISRLLNKAGFKKCLVAESGESALRILDREKIDIVFLDFLLPGMSGEKIVGEIRRKSPSMPVVFISGKPDLDEAEALRLDAQGFIKKPFDISDLINVLLRIFKARSS